MKRKFWLIVYYGFARWLPVSYTPVLGKFAKWMRYQCCRRIFRRCGRNVNIERGAYFAGGADIEIGDCSGLGINCSIPANTVLGDHVMFAPNVFILGRNHNFDRTDIPMGEQGDGPLLQTVIGNDVWIGRNVLMTPGRHIADGTIVGAGSVLTRDFPPYSIVGGNPARLIRSRKDSNI